MAYFLDQAKNFGQLSLRATLQSMINAKLSLHRFWPCHENRLIKTIQAIPPQPSGEFQVDFPLLRIVILIHSKGK